MVVLEDQVNTDRRQTNTIFIQKIDELSKTLSSFQNELADIRKDYQHLKEKIHEDHIRQEKDDEKLYRGLEKQLGDLAKSIKDQDEELHNNDKQNMMTVNQIASFKVDMAELKTEVKILSAASQKNAIYISLIVSIIGTLLPFAIKFFTNVG